MGAISSLHSNSTSTLSITNSATTTGTVVTAGYKYMVLHLPSTMNATSLTLHAGLTESATFYAAYNSNTALTHTVSTSRAVRIDVEGFGVIKLVSNNATPDDISYSLQSS